MTRTITQDTQLYGSSLWWEDSDPFISVVGFDREEVSRRIDAIAKDERKRADEDGDELEQNTRLCSGGVHVYSVSDFVSSKDEEHLQELAEGWHYCSVRNRHSGDTGRMLNRG